ncbi:MAG TPA: MerR family transcriptional regulator [Bacillota bacterium]|nr:MerR family transcriptional regulator [Bacillota bacterium]HOL10252.1 MerR family transcriptional regulator [Bacillota bacterium]
MGKKNDSIYPISVVMSMTNLTARQIRYYETHELIKPARSKGNQRLYTDADVESLLLIKSLLEKGLNLDGIKQIMNGAKPVESSNNVIETANPIVFNPQRPATPRLTSLYPVNNQEALINMLKHKRK